jgi:hypothetical protein
LASLDSFKERNGGGGTQVERGRGGGRATFEFCEEEVAGVAHSATTRGREGGGGSDCWRLKAGCVGQLGLRGPRRYCANAGPG